MKIDPSRLRVEARELASSGHELLEHKKSLFRGDRWEPTTPERVAEELTQGRAVAVRDRQGRQVLVPDGGELQELNGLRKGGDEGRLPSPLVAGAVKALEGSLSCRRDGERVPCDAYVAYNVLTGDGRFAESGLEWAKGDVKLRLVDDKAALTAAWLVAGFGSESSVDPRAAALKRLEQSGVTFSTGGVLETYAAEMPVDARYDGVVLGSFKGMPPAGLREARSRYDLAKRELGDRTARAWPLLSGSEESWHDRVRLLKDLPESDWAGLYPAVLGSVRQGEGLYSAARQAADLCRKAADAAPEERLKAFGHLRSLPDTRSGDCYLALYVASRRPDDCLELVKAVPSEGYQLAINEVRRRMADGQPAEQALDSVRRAMAGEQLDVSVELQSLGAPAEVAVRLEGLLARKDLPGAEVPVGQRVEALAALAAKGKDFTRAFEDMQFLASREALDSDSVKAFADVAGRCESGREARLAWVDLQTRPVEDRPSLLGVLGQFRTYAAARVVWDAMHGAEGAQRLAEMQPLVDSLAGAVPPESAARLAATHLSRPFSTFQIGVLGRLLGADGAGWQVGAGWSREGSVWTFEGEGEAALTSRKKMHLPEDGVFRFEAAADAAGLIVDVSYDGKDWLNALTIGPGASSSQDFSELAGRDVLVRVRKQGASEPVELSSLRLVETKVGPTQKLNPGTFARDNSPGKLLMTSDWVTLGSDPTRLTLVEEHTLYSKDQLTLEIRTSGGDWRPLRFWTDSKYSSDPEHVDLSGYSGQTVQMRWRLEALNGLPGLSPTIRAGTMTLTPVPRDQSQAMNLELLPKAAADAESLGGMIRSLDSDQRDPLLDGLSILTSEGGDLGAALGVWSSVGADGDLPVLAALLPEASAEEALAVYSELAGESSTSPLLDRARVRHGRSRSGYLDALDRLRAEGGDLRFLGEAQRVAGPEGADACWRAVAEPYRAETTAERAAAFLDLLKACGDSGQALKVWAQLQTWIQPGDSLPAAARAAAELAVVAGDRAPGVVARLQEKQQSGELPAALGPLVHRLVATAMLNLDDLDTALEGLAQAAREGKLEVTEEKVVVGGIELERRRG